MPKVGSKTFKFTKDGHESAKALAAETGQRYLSHTTTAKERKDAKVKRVVKDLLHE